MLRLLVIAVAAFIGGVAFVVACGNESPATAQQCECDCRDFDPTRVEDVRISVGGDNTDRVELVEGPALVYFVSMSLASENWPDRAEGNVFFTVNEHSAGCSSAPTRRWDMGSVGPTWVGQLSGPILVDPDRALCAQNINGQRASFHLQYQVLDRFPRIVP